MATLPWYPLTVSLCLTLTASTVFIPVEPPYSAGFLTHLRANTPERDRLCVMQHVTARWPTEQALYAAADAYRMTRGETDAVNFAIRSVTPACRSPIGPRWP